MNKHRRRGDAGFTLTELLMVMAVFIIMAGVAMPQLGRALVLYRLGIAVREVERELQTARVNSVQANRPVRVLFNCPATGQFRRVEVLGEPGLPDGRDNSLARCSDSTFPYPAPDLDPLTRPNLDGPVRYLPVGVAMAGIGGIEFLPNGTARSASAGSFTFANIGTTGVLATVTKEAGSRSVLVNGMGRVFVTGRQ
jgi:prepilin-type N-terminal cleavage/methylation domain-containing protein